MANLNSCFQRATARTWPRFFLCSLQLIEIMILILTYAYKRYYCDTLDQNLKTLLRRVYTGRSCGFMMRRSRLNIRIARQPRTKLDTFRPPRPKIGMVLQFCGPKQCVRERCDRRKINRDRCNQRKISRDRHDRMKVTPDRRDRGKFNGVQEKNRVQLCNL